MLAELEQTLKTSHPGDEYKIDHEYLVELVKSLKELELLRSKYSILRASFSKDV
jgi:hypothetical protein